MVFCNRSLIHKDFQAVGAFRGGILRQPIGKQRILSAGE
jgi:hypothetical protein